jgi:hypothetical protein
MPIDIQKQLDGKWEDGARPRDLFEMHLSSNPKPYVEQIMDGLTNGNRRVKNGSAELASLLAEQRPDLVYPYIDLFIENLGTRENLVRWEAVCTLGFLARSDSGKKIPPHLDALISLLSNKSIVLQGHALRALAKIAVAFPEEGKRIFDAMETSKTAFPGNKIGFVIEAMAAMAPLLELTHSLRDFVAGYQESDIKVVARKAKKALKILGEGTRD